MQLVPPLHKLNGAGGVPEVKKPPKCYNSFSSVLFGSTDSDLLGAFLRLSHALTMCLKQRMFPTVNGSFLFKANVAVGTAAPVK